MNIQELAAKTLDELKVNDTLRITGMTAHSLHILANGNESDCVFFGNAGGNAITVWVEEDVIIEAITNEFSDEIRAYRLGGEETIVKVPLLKRGFLYWIEP